MENFKIKTKEELDKQLSGVESLVGNTIKPESVRSEMLSLSLDELKEKYPKEFQTYLSILKTEAKLLHFPDIENKNEKPRISLLQAGARGICFKIDTLDSSHVIKPLESLAEKDISSKASTLGIGPKQFKTKEGYLHEEFIEGIPLLKIEKEKCTPEFMENLGQKFAHALKKLHENNILVNDQILTDDFSKSHMIIDKNEEVRFIDFGASVDLSNFPNITDEEVVSLMCTDPFMSFRMHGGIDSPEEEQKDLIKGYRENILSQIKTKEDIIQIKDKQLLNEGLYFLRERLPNVQSFIEGIKKEGF
jgi:tRNA A-37 threonylcarbamoyl transferase component Bud32